MSKGKAHKRKKSFWIQKKKKNPFLDEDILDCLLILSQISDELYSLILYNIGADYFLSPSYIHLKRIYGVPSILRRMQNKWMSYMKKKALDNFFYSENPYFSYIQYVKNEFRNVLNTEEENRSNFTKYFYSSGAWKDFVSDIYFFKKGLKAKSYEKNYDIDEFYEKEIECEVVTYFKNKYRKAETNDLCEKCGKNEFHYYSYLKIACKICNPFLFDSEKWTEWIEEYEDD